MAETHQEDRKVQVILDGLDGWNPSTSWAVQWEAINLYDNLFDTEDLSVVRGGSVGYDILTRRIDEVLAGAPRYAIVSSSASIVRLLARSEADAHAIGRRLVARVGAAPWRRASAYAAAPYADGIWGPLSQQVLARRMSTLGFDLGEEGSEVDALDHTRAASRKVKSSKPVSAAVASKYHLGRHSRLGLVEQVAHAAGITGLPALGDDSLAAWERRMAGEVPLPREQVRLAEDFVALGKASRLPGYIAVLEADGNAFGALFKGLPPAEFAARSLALERIVTRTLGRLFGADLAAAVDKLNAPGDAPVTQPLQILFQAGDELLLCFPAHRAFEVADQFPDAWRKAVDEVAKVPELAEAAAAFRDATLSIGLVVAHANTPISHLRDAAAELQYAAKATAKAAEGNPGWTVDWAVLKTHDTPPDGVLFLRELLRRKKKDEDPNAPERLATTRPQPHATFRAMYALAEAIAEDPPTAALKNAEGYTVRRWVHQEADLKPFTWSPEAAACWARHRGAVDALARHVGADPTSHITSDTFLASTPIWPDLVELLDVLRYTHGGVQ